MADKDRRTLEMRLEQNLPSIAISNIGENSYVMKILLQTLPGVNSPPPSWSQTSSQSILYTVLLISNTISVFLSQSDAIRGHGKLGPIFILSRRDASSLIKLSLTSLH